MRFSCFLNQLKGLEPQLGRLPLSKTLQNAVQAPFVLLFINLKDTE